MKSFARRALETTLFLLLVVSVLDVANAAAARVAPKDKEQDEKIEQNQTDITDLREEIRALVTKTESLEKSNQTLTEQLETRVKAQAKEASAAQNGLAAQLETLGDQVATLQQEQAILSKKIENAEFRSRVEFALAGLLGAGALLLCLWQMRTLRSLISARPEKPIPEDEIATPPPPPFPPSRHQEIAELLAHLRNEAPQLAAGFGDPALRERFLGEYDAPLSAMLERLRTSEQVEDTLEESWLGPDLVPTLDGLARFYSEAVEEGRHGRVAAKDLAGELRAWLYDRFSPACSRQSWFAIDPIEPYVTAFDHNVHSAVTGSDVDGAAGTIIAIKAIGRRDPKSGDVIHKAEVIVGR